MASGSLIDFESSWKKAEHREKVREIRGQVLEKAKTKAEWDQKRRDQEDSWMLPELGKKLKIHICY